VLASINDLVLPLVSELWQKFNMQASSGYTGLYPLLSTGSWCSQWVSCGRKYAIIHPCYCWWSLRDCHCCCSYCLFCTAFQPTWSAIQPGVLHNLVVGGLQGFGTLFLLLWTGVYV
jgi:hypothetical protein